MNSLNFFDSILVQTDEFIDVSPGDETRGISPNVSTTDNIAPVHLDSQNRAASQTSLSSNDSTIREQDDANIIDSRMFFEQHGDHSFEGTSENVNSPFISRKSYRISKLPKKFDDFVIEGKVNYGVEKVVYYSCLCKENFCFVSNLK